MLSQPLVTQPRDELPTPNDRDITESNKSSKADSEMTDHDDNHSNHVPLGAMFQTAGTNQPIRVTDESLSRASELFSPSSRTLKERISFESEREDNISSIICTNNSTRNSSQPNDAKSAEGKTYTSTFQTAGSDKSVDASKDSIMKANANANASFSSVENELMNRISAENINDGDNSQSSSHQSDDGETSGKSPPSSVVLSPMVQTTDKTETNSSTDSLSKADRIIFGQELPSINVSNASFDTAAHAQNMTQHIDNNSNYKSDSLIATPNLSCLMFQTAGKKQTIHISAESLSKSIDFFSVKDENDGDRNMPTCNFSGASAQLFPTFQTAGRKQPIHVSDDSLTKANEIFSRIESREYTTHNEPSSSLNRTNKSISTGDVSQTETAGKGVAVQVLAGNLSKADDMFPHIGKEQRGELHTTSEKPSIGTSCNNTVGTPLDMAQNEKSGEKVEAQQLPYQTTGKDAEIHSSVESLSKTNSLISCLNEPRSQQTLNSMPKSLGDSATSSVSSNLAKDNNSTVSSVQRSIPRAIFNPYTRKSIANIASKRTISQASQTSSLNDNNPKIRRASTAVDNPYAKSKTTISSANSNNARQSLVKNPYASSTYPPIKATIAPSASKVAMHQATQSTKHSQATELSFSGNKSNQSSSVNRSIPTSRFFSMADRLPSRNVSYQPAEILSVGELYRYLYHDHDERTFTVGKDDTGPRDNSKEPSFHKLASVRITGVLLSCNYSDEEIPKLYGKGQWLLIGDPLERTRCVKKELPSQLSSMGEIAQPFVQKEAATSNTPRQSDLKSTDKSTPADVSLATPSSFLNTPSLTNKSTLSCRLGGLLNDKKRKFVYSKGQGRNSLSSSKTLLTAKKFQTPKRVTTSSTINNISGKRGAQFPSANKGALLPPKTASNKIQSPNTIIQSHTSPIVPVWNGSTRDDSGLNGSVIGDLVMLMGEIVIEQCDRCQESDMDNAKDADSTSAILSGAHDIRNAARFIASLAQQRDRANTKCCYQCVKFLQARFVKNANGTDMNLQKEALRVRREYLKKRRDDVVSIISGNQGNLAT